LLLPVLFSELSVGLAKAVVTVTTDPFAWVEVEVTVTTAGAVDTVCPRLLVVVTNTGLVSVLL
jgi:hypothetical protein